MNEEAALSPSPAAAEKEPAPATGVAAAAIALGRALGQYRGALIAAEAGVFEDKDIEALHDFRVAIRRTRSLLKTLGHLFDPVAVKRFRDDFAWLARSAGSQRDLDVFLSQLDRQQRALKVHPEAFIPLRKALERRRRLAHANLMRTLRSERYRKLKTDWFHFLDKARAEASSQPSAKEAANAAILRMYQQVTQRGAAIRPRSKIERLHALRKDCKELRYLLEAFGNLYDSNGVGKLTSALKNLQDVLGEVCDLDVQRHGLDDVSGHLRPQLSVEARSAVAAWKKALSKKQLQIREKFGKRFQRLMRKRNRRLFKSLFAEGAT